MKTHRRIIIISLIASVLSFIAILFFEQESRTFQIFMGLMGSALVTFLVEIPNYLSIKEENENKLYYSLLNIKIQIIVLENSINGLINSNSILNEKICDRIIQFISIYLNNLNSFDSNYYMWKKKRECMQEKIIRINNIFSELEQFSYLFESAYITKRIQIIEKEGKNRNVMSNEMLDELNTLLKKWENYYKVVNEIGNSCFSGKLKKQWENNEIEIKKRNKAIGVVSKIK